MILGPDFYPVGANTLSLRIERPEKDRGRGGGDLPRNHDTQTHVSEA